MSARSAFPFVAVAVILAVGLTLARRGSPVAPPLDGAPAERAGPAAERGGSGATTRRSEIATPEPVVIETDPQSGALLRADNLHAAGRRTAVEIGPCDHGIRCPDGSFLPLLNGVDAAPPILRAEERGPLAPVVAIIVDRDGWEWYEHADGATSTCRPQRIVGADGRGELRVITLHNAPDASMREAPLELDPARSR